MCDLCEAGHDPVDTILDHFQALADKDGISRTASIVNHVLVGLQELANQALGRILTAHATAPYDVNEFAQLLQRPLSDLQYGEDATTH